MRLVLLTDLHFGRASPDLVQPLLDAVNAASPDLVLIAGDFVQRARASQFRMAQDFLQRLGQDWIAVPGNHDIPLFNLPARILWPRAAYRRWINADTEPHAQTGDVRVVGLDTTSRWHHQRGRITNTQVSRVSEILREEAGRRTVLIVAHHPFHQNPEVEKKIMIGAADALETWSECGPHVILSGHLHTWTVEPFVVRKSRSMTLQVHCGTGLSTRLRGEPNDFAVFDIDGDLFHIRRMVAQRDVRNFVELGRYSYRSGDKGWQLES